MLMDRLGPRAGQELFSRIDGSLRQGTVIFGASVREARGGFSKAHTAGCAQFVIQGRSGRSRKSTGGPSDGLVIMKLGDLEAVVRAGQDKFDWAEAFAPRSGLEAATTSPKLKVGSRGRRQLRT